jgi:hypothetical protein
MQTPAPTLSRPHTFAVRLLSALTIGDKRVLAGAVVDLDANTAADLIRDGRAFLANDNELPRLVDAVGLRQRAPDGR